MHATYHFSSLWYETQLPMGSSVRDTSKYDEGGQIQRLPVLRHRFSERF